jgi:predicted nuclease of predicted toxin-antitoxin system
VRILLDENLNWRLEQFLPGHTVKSVPRIGWAGLKNGKLLARAQENFDVIITMDGSMASQQNLSKLKIAIVALRAASNRLADTSPLMPKVIALLPTLKPGKVVKVTASY